jgi:hypothetical protein
MPKGKHLTFPEVRDAIMREKEFTARTLAHRLGVKPAAAKRWIDTVLAMDNGMVAVVMEGGGPNPTVYEFVRPKADKVVARRKEVPPEVATAQLESQRAKKERRQVHTRRVRTGNKRSQEIVRAAKRAGAKVDILNNNHVLVERGGLVERIALTPSQGSASSDRRKLAKKLGI